MHRLAPVSDPPISTSVSIGACRLPVVVPLRWSRHEPPHPAGLVTSAYTDSHQPAFLLPRPWALQERSGYLQQLPSDDTNQSGSSEVLAFAGATHVTLRFTSLGDWHSWSSHTPRRSHPPQMPSQALPPMRAALLGLHTCMSVAVSGCFWRRGW